MINTTNDENRDLDNEIKKLVDSKTLSKKMRIYRCSEWFEDEYQDLRDVYKKIYEMWKYASQETTYNSLLSRSFNECLFAIEYALDIIQQLSTKED